MVKNNPVSPNGRPPGLRVQGFNAIRSPAKLLLSGFGWVAEGCGFVFAEP